MAQKGKFLLEFLDNVGIFNFPFPILKRKTKRGKIFRMGGEPRGLKVKVDMKVVVMVVVEVGGFLVMKKINK